MINIAGQVAGSDEFVELVVRKAGEDPHARLLAELMGGWAEYDLEEEKLTKEEVERAKGLLARLEGAGLKPTAPFLTRGRRSEG